MAWSWERRGPQLQGRGQEANPQAQAPAPVGKAPSCSGGTWEPWAFTWLFLEVTPEHRLREALPASPTCQLPRLPRCSAGPHRDSAAEWPFHDYFCDSCLALGWLQVGRTGRGAQEAPSPVAGEEGRAGELAQVAPCIAALVWFW